MPPHRERISCILNHCPDHGPFINGIFLLHNAPVRCTSPVPYSNSPGRLMHAAHHYLPSPVCVEKAEIAQARPKLSRISSTSSQIRFAQPNSHAASGPSTQIHSTNPMLITAPEAPPFKSTAVNSQGLPCRFNLDLDLPTTARHLTLSQLSALIVADLT